MCPFWYKQIDEQTEVSEGMVCLPYNLKVTSHMRLLNINEKSNFTMEKAHRKNSDQNI